MEFLWVLIDVPPISIGVIYVLLGILSVIPLSYHTQSDM